MCTARECEGHNQLTLELQAYEVLVPSLKVYFMAQDAIKWSVATSIPVNTAYLVTYLVSFTGYISIPDSEVFPWSIFFFNSLFFL